jgi:hypothetical protein
MPISVADYLAMLARTRKKSKDIGPPPGASREVESIHTPILEWCRQQTPMPAVIHSRSDKRASTNLGVPDFVILWHGNCILIEAKTKTGKLSFHQNVWKHLAEVNEFPVHIIRSYDEFLKLVEEIKTRAAKG